MDSPQSSDEEKRPEVVVIKGHTADEPLKPYPDKSESGHKEEEVSLDFSKLKKWWNSDSSKKKDHSPAKSHASHSKSQKKESEDIRLPNFKNFGSKETKENLRKFLQFFLTWQVLILILIPLGTSVYLRTIPIGMPIAEEWAQTSMNNQIQNQIASQVIAQYPNLPDSKKQELIEKEFQKFISENIDQYNIQKEAIADQFRQKYQDDNGQRYLPNIDPYYYARHARSIVEKGHVGDYLNEEGIPINNHQTAPREKPAERHFHMFFTAYFFELVRFFNKDAGFLNTIAWIPIIVASSAIIPAFFIARRYGGSVSGFFGAMILAVNQVFIGRTVAGVVDTDAYTVAFPLFITWAFMMAFGAKTQKKQVIFSTLTAFLLALFSFAWSGWWYIFDFILATLGIYFIYVLITHISEFLKSPKKMLLRKEVKEIFTISAVLVPLTVFFTTLIQGFRTFSYSRGFDKRDRVPSMGSRGSGGTNRHWRAEKNVLSA